MPYTESQFMDEQKSKKWYKSKLFFVPALLISGMVMGSAMDTSGNQDAEIASPVMEVTQVPTEKTIQDDPTNNPTLAVTSTSIPTVRPRVPTSLPTKVYTAPTKIYVAPTVGNPGGSCNCSLTCTRMTSCAEAQYQLNSCGCSARDGDGDGIACDGAPLHCQN